MNRDTVISQYHTFFLDISTDSKVTSQEIKAANHDADTSVQTELAPPISPSPPTSVTMAKQVNKASFLIRDAPRKGTCRSKEVTLNSKKEPGRDQTFVRKTRDSPAKQETASVHGDRYGMRMIFFICNFSALWSVYSLCKLI